VLTLERTGSSLTLVATPAPGTAVPRPHLLAVGAYRRADDGLQQVGRALVEVSGERTPLELPEADLYLVNDDDLTFVRTRPEDADQLFATAPELPTVLGRGVAVATLRDLLDEGEVSAATAVDCLTRILRRETAPTTVEPYLRFAAEVAELWSPDDERSAHLRTVASVCRDFLERGEHNQVARRFLSRVGDAEDLSALADAATSDVDLRWRILTRQAELGVPVDADALEELVRADPDPDSWVRALAVRTAAPSESAKAEAWDAVVEERRVPITSVGLVATALWRPGQDDLVAPYAERYLEAVPRMAEGGMIPAMVYASRMFPLFGIGPEYVDRAVAASEGAAPIVRGRLEERADEVRRMLVSRGSSAGSPA
jgi:aminopeptidase N